jgi:nucleoside-diphosphate-sugar epimerase
MQILVTGGCGYIGAVLVPRLLEAGHEVTVLDNLVHRVPSLLGAADHPRFTFVHGDARNSDVLRPAVRAADLIIPLAAVVGAPACDRDPVTAENVNLGAIRLLNRLRSPDQAVIFPTTNSGYGTTSGETYCTEETPLEPVSLYGRTKVEAERELLAAGTVITLRLATVFGVSPRMRTDLLVNFFVWEAVTRRYLVLFEKDFKRNYVHIRDVADCLGYCIEHFDRLKDNAYNCGLDEANYSKAELAKLIQAEIPSLHVHHAEIGHDPDRRNYVVSNEKLRRAGFEARRSVQSGVRELISAYRMLAGLGAYANA